MDRLPNAPPKYDFNDQSELRRAIEAFARKPLAMYSETGSTARIDGGLTPLEIYGPSRSLIAQFQAGTLILYPQDGTNEGGELNLVGAAAYRSWTIDTFQGLLRHFSGATPIVEWDLLAYQSYHTSWRMLPTGDTVGISLMRSAANNFQFRSNDNGFGTQDDTSKSSWVIALGEGAADNLAVYRRTPGTGTFVQNFAVDNSGGAGDLRILAFDVTGASLKRFSRGAVDSGGVGFRVVRITN